MTDLIERLRGGKCPECAGWGEVAYFGEMVGCTCLGRYETPISMETRTEAADEIAALRERVEALEGMLVAEREDNLWNAYNAGHVRDGKWDHLCMSDGEWLARECGFNVSDCRFDDEEIRNAIPKVARAILSKQEPGRVEVVDEGESGNDAIAAIGGDRG